MMVEVYSPCGIVCDDCDWFKGIKEPHCEGCNKVKGKPSWGECETYPCVKDKEIEHCGQCGAFPCQEFMTRYDPGEGPVDAVIRAGMLAYRKRHGDEKAAKLDRRIRS